MWTLQKCIISTWVSHGGDYYLFTVLLFGLSTTYYIFTKMLCPLVHYWRGLGIRVVELS